MRRPLVGLLVRHLQLRLAEWAISRPLSRRASLEIDRRFVALEQAMRRETGGRAQRRAA